jgi:hypothetical protein
VPAAPSTVAPAVFLRTPEGRQPAVPLAAAARLGAKQAERLQAEARRRLQGGVEHWAAEEAKRPPALRGRAEQRAAEEAKRRPELQGSEAWSTRASPMRRARPDTRCAEECACG